MFAKGCVFAVFSPTDTAAGGSAHEWLENEAAYLERGLLRSYERLAQVRLEIQVCNLWLCGWVVGVWWVVGGGARLH